jgi:hypothetical protein
MTKILSSPVLLTSCSALSSDNLPVHIETSCRLSFQHPPDRPDFRYTYLAKVQTHFSGKIPFIPELYNEVAIDTCVENSSGAVLEALSASNLKRRPRDDPQPAIPAGIQGEIA